METHIRDNIPKSDERNFLTACTSGGPPLGDGSRDPIVPLQSLRFRCPRNADEHCDSHVHLRAATLENDTYWQRSTFSVSPVRNRGLLEGSCFAISDLSPFIIQGNKSHTTSRLCPESRPYTRPPESQNQIPLQGSRVLCTQPWRPMPIYSRPVPFRFRF